MGSMAFCISGGKQYRQQRAAFWVGLCICRQHCAVNGINVRKIIRCLLLPQFAVRQIQREETPDFSASSSQVSFWSVLAFFRRNPISLSIFLPYMHLYVQCILHILLLKCTNKSLYQRGQCTQKNKKTLDIAYKKTQYPEVFCVNFYPLGTFRGIYVF